MKYKKLGIYIVVAVVAVMILVMLIKCSVNTKEPEVVQQQNTYVPEPTHIMKEIQKGESIYQVLTEMGASIEAVADFTIFMGEYVDISTIQPGDSLKVKFATDGVTVEEIIYKPDLTTSHIMYNLGDSLSYGYIQEPVEEKLRIVTGEVENTLDAALLSAGLEASVKQEVNNALEASVSFQTDTRKGDVFNVMVRERYFHGKKLPRARLLYASYDGKVAGHKEAFRYTDDNVSSALNGMFSTDGKALVHNAVRTPLDYMHVTSPFGKRIHPISRKWKMHLGMDLRARTGTPVYAVAAGRVTSAGTNRGNGKEVRIKHNDMLTHYAHLSKVYVRKGQVVKKGTKIGLSGNTGYSQAPHLHFGLQKNGKWINPKKLRMVGAQKLTGDKLKRFKDQIAEIRRDIAKLSPSDQNLFPF